MNLKDHYAMSEHFWMLAVLEDLEDYSERNGLLKLKNAIVDAKEQAESDIILQWNTKSVYSGVHTAINNVVEFRPLGRNA